MKNYPDFEIMANVIQNGVLGFIVKYIRDEATEANDLGHILLRWFCCVNNSTFSQRLHKT